MSPILDLMQTLPTFVYLIPAIVFFGTGLVPGFFAILCAVYALSRLPAATFGTLAYFEPIAVVVFGWTLFGETLSALQLAGCLVIIAGGVGMTWLAAGRSGERVDSARPGR